MGFWYDAFTEMGLETDFLNGLGQFHYRKFVDDERIMYRLYKKGTYQTQSANAEGRREIVVPDATPYIEITFKNKSVKIVLRSKRAILSTLNVKLSPSPIGVNHNIDVNSELKKIISYIKVLYG